MTRELYYEDSHLFAFRARVIACEERKGGFAVELDETAFFPEGGGQPADTGRIGEARVLDAHKQNGRILHYTDRALPVGETLDCEVDREQRLRRMQNHSGEHIVSGLIFRKFGFDNVGFHMGADCMTMDYSGELSWEQLGEIEQLANEAVRADLPLKIWFPESGELRSLVYRSKLELTENVRIVEIPGIDRCACCAPHVTRTGEVGAVKILSAERHRGGVRITALCGLDAAEESRRQQAELTAAAQLLSAKRGALPAAVERLLAAEAGQKERIAVLSLELARLRAEAAEETEGNLCLFDEVLDEVGARELVNLLMPKCRVAAVFLGEEKQGFRYVVGSRTVDLRRAARTFNTAVSGRGGGKPEMIQGSAAASAETIRRAVAELK